MAEEKNRLEQLRDILAEYDRKATEGIAYFIPPEIKEFGKKLQPFLPFQNLPDATPLIQEPSVKNVGKFLSDTAITGAELTPIGYLTSKAATLPIKAATSASKKTDNVFTQDEILDIYTNTSKRKDRIALRNATKNDEGLNSFINTINELPAQTRGLNQTRYNEDIVKQFSDIFNSQNPFKIEYLKQSLGNQYKGLYNSARDKKLLSTDVKFKGEDTTIKSILEQGKGKLKSGVSTDDIAQQIEDV